MFTLFKFEVKKILSMKIVWVCIFLTIFICVAYGFLMTPETPNANWKNQYIETIEELKVSKEKLELEIGDMLLNDKEVDAFFYKTISSMEEMIVKYEYAVQNNIQIEQTSRVSFLTRVIPIISFSVVLLFLIFASTTISTEVANGKIRCLLLRPISRRNIFLNKYAAMVLSSFAVVFLIIVAVYLFSVAYFDNTHMIDLVVENGVVHEIDLRISLLVSIVNLVANLLVFETIAFSCSAFFTHPITSLVLSISLYIGLQLSKAVLAGFKFYKYFPIKHVDIIRVVNSPNWEKAIEYVFFDIVIVFIFITAIIIVAYKIFTERDL